MRKLWRAVAICNSTTNVCSQTQSENQWCTSIRLVVNHSAVHTLLLMAFETMNCSCTNNCTSPSTVAVKPHQPTFCRNFHLGPKPDAVLADSVSIVAPCSLEPAAAAVAASSSSWSASPSIVQYTEAPHKASVNTNDSVMATRRETPGMPAGRSRHR